MRATARPWLPALAVTSVSGWSAAATRSPSSVNGPVRPVEEASTWAQAHEAPSTLNAGSPSRKVSSFANTRPTPSSSASAGSSTSGVGSYPGSPPWKAEAAVDGAGQAQVRAVGRAYQGRVRAAGVTALMARTVTAPHRSVQRPLLSVILQKQ